MNGWILAGNSQQRPDDPPCDEVLMTESLGLGDEICLVGLLETQPKLDGRESWLGVNHSIRHHQWLHVVNL